MLCLSPCSTEITSAPFVQVSSCKYPRLKEVDDVLGGAAAWENVDTTDGEATTLFIECHL